MKARHRGGRGGDRKHSEEQANGECESQIAALLAVWVSLLRADRHSSAYCSFNDFS